MKISLFSKTFSDLVREFGGDAALKISRHIYKNHQFNFDKLSEIKKEHREVLEQTYSLDLCKIEKVYQSEDQTVKFLMQFSDGLSVETVLIPFYKRYTLCLSSQVGCAMACSFCFTGTQGLKRNLNHHEIIAQYLTAWMWLKQNRPEKSIAPNIVFMGQGEPLHNFDEVKKATELFLEKELIGLGPRQITLSTAGYLPGLQRFNEFPSINLALSLHSTNDVVRSKLIPLNKNYDLTKLFQTLDEVELMKRQYITFEYLMIKDLNIGEEDVKGLVQFLKKRNAIINLIPFNPFPGSLYKRPERKEIDHFKKSLVDHGLHVMIRTTKGDEILAACGQLKSSV